MAQPVVAPPGYLVNDSPNEGENGTYMCPHETCEGLVCDDIAECCSHEKEWHSPPYNCAMCEMLFPAHPALLRHIKATGHQRWVCGKEGCGMRGVCFGDFEAYYAHYVSSTAHREARQQQGAQPHPTEDYDAGEEDDDAYGEPPIGNEERCFEPCCAHFMRRFPSQRAASHHHNSSGHVQAVQKGQALLDKELAPEELEMKQEAMRTFRCDVEDCAHYGKKLASNASYFRHIETAAHRSPSKRNPTKRSLSDGLNKQSPSKRPRGHGNNRMNNDQGVEAEPQPSRMPICDTSSCTEFGYEFPSTSELHQHNQSMGYRQAQHRLREPMLYSLEQAQETRRPCTPRSSQDESPSGGDVSSTSSQSITSSWAHSTQSSHSQVREATPIRRSVQDPGSRSVGWIPRSTQSLTSSFMNSSSRRVLEATPIRSARKLNSKSVGDMSRSSRPFTSPSFTKSSSGQVLETRPTRRSQDPRSTSHGIPQVSGRAYAPLPTRLSSPRTYTARTFEVTPSRSSRDPGSTSGAGTSSRDRFIEPPSSTSSAHPDTGRAFGATPTMSSLSGRSQDLGSTSKTSNIPTYRSPIWGSSLLKTPPMNLREAYLTRKNQELQEELEEVYMRLLRKERRLQRRRT